MRTYPNDFRFPKCEVSLMTWETVPRKRKKKGNAVTLNILSGYELEKGDKIIGLKWGGMVVGSSRYGLLRKSRRGANHPLKDLITLRVVARGLLGLLI